MAETEKNQQIQGIPNADPGKKRVNTGWTQGKFRRDPGQNKGRTRTSSVETQGRTTLGRTSRSKGILRADTG